MSYVAIVKSLLFIVNWCMKRASDKEQRQIGADRVVKANLVNILVQVKTGKRIDAQADHYTDADVDAILQSHFRD